VQAIPAQGVLLRPGYGAALAISAMRLLRGTSIVIE
jgi:hypothetical protein